MKRWMFGLLLCAAMLLGMSRAAVACPMCKDSITDTSVAGNVDGQGMEAALPGGFNVSVYYMLISVFVTGALVIGVIAKNIRASTAAAASRAGLAPVPNTPRS